LITSIYCYWTYEAENKLSGCKSDVSDVDSEQGKACVASTDAYLDARIEAEKVIYLYP